MRVLDLMKDTSEHDFKISSIHTIFLSKSLKCFPSTQMPYLGILFVSMFVSFYCQKSLRTHEGVGTEDMFENSCELFIHLSRPEVKGLCLFQMGGSRSLITQSSRCICPVLYR